MVTVTYPGLPEELAALDDELELEEELLEELELELEDDDEELELLELEDSVPPPQAIRPAAMIPTIMHCNDFIEFTLVIFLLSFARLPGAS